MARSSHTTRSRFTFAIFSLAIASAGVACSGVDSDLFSGLSDGGKSSDAGGDARSNRDASRTDASSGFDSGPPGKDGGGPNPGKIVPATCGSSVTCTNDSPTCCATQGDGFTTSTSYACSTDPSSCNATADAPIECRDNNDCTGGQLCCGELLDLSGQGGYTAVRCESSCDAKFSDGGVTSHVPFCSDGTPNACAASGFTCQASSPLPGFNVCGQD